MEKFGASFTLNVKPQATYTPGIEVPIPEPYLKMSEKQQDSFLTSVIDQVAAGKYKDSVPLLEELAYFLKSMTVTWVKAIVISGSVTVISELVEGTRRVTAFGIISKVQSGPLNNQEVTGYILGQHPDQAIPVTGTRELTKLLGAGALVVAGYPLTTPKNRYLTPYIELKDLPEIIKCKDVGAPSELPNTRPFFKDTPIFTDGMGRVINPSSTLHLARNIANKQKKLMKKKVFNRHLF